MAARLSQYPNAQALDNLHGSGWELNNERLAGVQFDRPADRPLVSTQDSSALGFRLGSSPLVYTLLSTFRVRCYQQKDLLWFPSLLGFRSCCVVPVVIIDDATNDRPNDLEIYSFVVVFP
jgi:hypothetical protein